MKFRARKQLRFGPFRVNLTQHGLSSISLKFGRFSHNFKTGRNTYDSPGPGYFSWGGKRRGAADAQNRVDPE